MLLCKCNAVNHDFRTKPPKIIGGLIESISIAMNNAHALWQMRDVVSAMKNRDFMPGRNQSVGNLLSDETRSPENQYTHRLSLLPIIDPAKRRSVFGITELISEILDDHTGAIGSFVRLAESLTLKRHSFLVRSRIRFRLVRQLVEPASVIVVKNWMEEVKRRVPTRR